MCLKLWQVCPIFSDMILEAPHRSYHSLVGIWFVWLYITAKSAQNEQILADCDYLYCTCAQYFFALAWNNKPAVFALMLAKCFPAHSDTFSA